MNICTVLALFRVAFCPRGLLHEVRYTYIYIYIAYIGIPSIPATLTYKAKNDKQINA